MTEMQQTECERHPTLDYFGPGTTIFKCAHLGPRFVIAMGGILGAFFVDYVEDLSDGEVLVEAHFSMDEWETAFDALETLMLFDVPPNPERSD